MSYYNKYPDYNFSASFVAEKNVNGKIVHRYKDTMSEEQRTDFRQCSIIAGELEEQYRKELFQLISDKINFWWD
jgi:hypothetical protein